jgi:hypothetical protein
MGGGGSCTSAATRAWGASSIRVPKKNARCPGLGELLPKAMRGVLELSSTVPGGGGQEEKSRCFATIHKPCRVCKKKAIAVHVARW